MNSEIQEKKGVVISRASDRYIYQRGGFTIRMIKPGIRLNNPADQGLGPLGRFDHSTLEPGFLIGMHPHNNDEILSYMRIGSMLHKDSKGIAERIHGTYLMMMNAGSEIWHSEEAPANEDGVEMLQLFFRPEKDNLEPGVQFHELDNYLSQNEWRLIGGPENSNAPLKIRSAAWFLDQHLNTEASRTPKLNGLTGYLYVFEGSITLPAFEETLNKGDGMVVYEDEIELLKIKDADLVFFILDEQSVYSRSGAYSG